MSISKTILYPLLVLTGLFAIEIKLEAVDSYSVAALPTNFYIGSKSGNKLNDEGQVAGYLSNEKEYSNTPDPYIGAKAAYWDSKKGATSIKLDAYKSIGSYINDHGFIALSLYKEKQPFAQQTPRVVLWNIKTDEFKYGPMGRTEDLNNDNEVLSTKGGTRTIWDTKDNTIINNPDIGHLKKYSLNIFNTNRNGMKLSQIDSFDLSLFYSGKEHLLVIKEGELGSYYLNDNDEVVAMVITKTGDKNQNKIVRFKKGKDPTTSDALQNHPDLQGYEYFDIIAFNNKGQILIKAAEKNTYANPLFFYRLFFLTPMIG